jgi:DNA topoisomerase I
MVERAVDSTHSDTEGPRPLPKPLVIVESPAKAKTIAGFLGSDFVIKASYGHIRDLPGNASQVPAKYKGTDAGRLGIDVDDHFRPIYVVPPDKRKYVNELKAALKNASELYLATDEDREGEAISWHVLEVLKPDVPVKRMVFHEITRPAIEQAISDWRDLDMKLVEAQEGRRVLDRLFGYEISPVLWKKVMPRLSAGRVQSVATRLVVERERARIAFRSGEWWDLDGAFTAHGTGFRARLATIDGQRIPAGKDFDPATGRPATDVVVLDEAGARSLAERLGDSDFQVTSVESTPWRQQPPAPFITSTLQQEASRKLRFGASHAMSVAQRLYDRGYITYMRTDSTNLSEQAVTAARRRIRDLYGDEYLPDKPRTHQRKVKNAQEAHEAIRPAGDQMRTPDELRRELDADEVRLYELVWMRTIACQMSDARGRRVSARIGATSSTGELCEFTASGRTIEFPGFLRAYVEGADDPDAELEDKETPIPPVTDGETVTCDALDLSSHTTQPPARYTEASLVKELEERGIGRPSTYAAVVGTIQDRGYVWRKGNALVPSWTGFASVQLLERHFAPLVDYGFTAEMEEDLDLIARHESESETWLNRFYFGNGATGLLELVGDEHLTAIDAREVNTIPLGVDADGNDVAVRVGRFGPYLQRGDDTAPLPEDLVPDELTIADALERLERGADGGRVLGIEPATGLEVVARDGRYGPYVSVGEHGDNGEKPRTGSLLKTMTLDSLSLDEALQLLSLPRIVGVDAEGNEITALNGRYGPYLKKGTDSRSLETEEQLFTITMAEAEAVFALPKRRGRGAAKPPIADLGPHPDSAAPIRVLDGRFGPYVTDGTYNATIPRGTDPAGVTFEQAVALLRARAERGPAKKRKTAKKKPAAKRAPKKKAPAKKAAAKKAGAKKAAKRTTAKKAVAAGSSNPVPSEAPDPSEDET